MPNQSKTQKHEITEQHTQKIPNKKDTRLTGTHLTFDNCVKENHFKLEVMTPTEAEDFFSSLWPLLEKKLYSWIEKSLTKKIDTIAITAVYKYVSSEEFKTNLSDSLNFDINQMQAAHEKLSKDVKDVKTVEDKISKKMTSDEISQRLLLTPSGLLLAQLVGGSSQL